MVYIGVIGESATDSLEARQAYTVGRLIAQNGATLICGGLFGVMEAAARGAKSSDGMTIGILPGASREDANKFIDIALPTGLGEARNVIIARASDALIAVGGSYGTLSEIAFALKFGKPVISLDSWKIARQGDDRSHVIHVSTPEEAVERALSFTSQAMKT
jgi:uncharacterized protein (TIGR00725 family)